MISRIKGTQDYLDLSLFNFVINETKKHLERYNFTEISTPILEPTELFKRSLGTQTDVVNKEMYTFGEDNYICLRPEATASTVRAFVENHVQQIPWKVFSWGSMFRHERPQKGRYREFHQISIETIGSHSIAQDALFIKMLDSLFSETLNLDSYALHLNFIGTREDRKNHKKALLEFLEKHKDSICKTCLERKDTNTLRIFDCKQESCQKLYKQAPRLTDYLSEESEKEWRNLKQQLDILSVSYIENPLLVRGLDYYNKTVFEFASQNLGAQSAFCGGGRYDHLVQEIGGKEDQPAIGAAMGLERLLLLLEPEKAKLAIPQPLPLTVIIPLEEEQNDLALLIGQELLNHKKTTDILLDEASTKSKMRKANKLGAQWALIVGPEEQKNKTAVLKNMITGSDETIAQTEIINKI